MLTPALSPALAHIIERPRLIARLEEGGGSRVSVFAAPAGYGKTTLARQWSERQTGQVAWYRTTRASGDIALLAVQFDELLASLAPELPREPGKVASIASVNPSPKPLGRALVRTFESITDDILLIVDEWEAAETPESDELLSMLVDGIPVRWLITTRERPDWFAPKLEVYGEGLEIGVDELTMTDEEAAQVLSTSGAVAGRARVMRTAAGWPAVLGLAAMSGEVDFTSGNAISRKLYEFLARELLASATAETQEALMLIAVAGVTDLARASILLQTRATSALSEAIAHGLIAAPDGTSLWLHPLLKELLLQRFRDVDKELRARLLTTCRHLFAEGLWDEALSVAETTKNSEFICEAVSIALDHLLAGGRTSSLSRWVTVAREASADSGLIDYLEAELRLRMGEFDPAMALGAKAAAALEGDHAARAEITAGQAAHMMDRPDRAEEHAEMAISAARRPETLQSAYWLRFLAVLERQPPDLSQRLEDFQAIAGSGIRQSIMIATGRLSIAAIEGNLEEALADARSTLSMVPAGADPIAHTGLLSIYAYALIMRCEYERSLDAIVSLTQAAGSCGIEFPLRYAELYAASARIGLRQFAAADKSLTALDRATQDEPGSYFRCIVPIQRARLYASIGDVQRAADVLSLGPAQSAIRSATGEFFGWQAMIAAILGKDSEALTLARSAENCGLEARSLSLIARSLVALSNDPVAARSLIDGAIATEVWDPLLIAIRASQAFARFLAEKPAMGPWLRRLLAGSNDWSLASSIGLRITRPAKPKQRLSPREQEVFGLIAQGLTNEEISKALFISLSTTKVHVKHIFEKLGVRSRIEAARAWAEEEQPC